MVFKSRGSRVYAYRSAWVAGRVVSQYVGSFASESELEVML